MWHWVKAFIGVGTIAGSILLTCAHVEPFTTWYFPLVWYGLILFMDSLRAARGRRSLIFQRPFSFLCLLFWSATIWFLFEVINFRIANWYYVFASDDKVVRIVGAWLSFATVLPALYLIEKLLEEGGLFSRGPRFGLKMNGKKPVIAAWAGLACLVLPLVWPRYAYPLVWAFGFLLPIPWFLKRVESTFLTDLTASKPGKLLRILCAGLICGLFWEGFNHFAVIRWIYTVPFFEVIKVFEMPPLGFCGFPPFALECVVLYSLLAGMGWAPELEGWGRRRQALTARPVAACAACMAALLFGAAALEGMERYTIDSYTPRPGNMTLSREAEQLLLQHDIFDCFSLGKALDRPDFARALAETGDHVNEVRSFVELALLRGMGTENAKALNRLGIHTVAELAKQDPRALAAALSVTGREGFPRTTTAKAGIWIRAAGRAAP